MMKFSGERYATVRVIIYIIATLIIVTGTGYLAYAVSPKTIPSKFSFVIDQSSSQSTLVKKIFLGEFLTGCSGVSYRKDPTTFVFRSLTGGGTISLYLSDIGLHSVTDAVKLQVSFGQTTSTRPAIVSNGKATFEINQSEIDELDREMRKLDSFSLLVNGTKIPKSTIGDALDRTRQCVDRGDETKNHSQAQDFLKTLLGKMVHSPR